MNKKLKIATAAVAVVMAGSMTFGMFGCNNSKDPNKPSDSTDISGVTVNFNIGDAAQRSISFGYGELLSGTVKLPDGKSYTSASLKPAWAAFEKMVGCKFNDVWQNSSGKADNAKKAKVESQKLSAMDIITDSATNISNLSSDMLDFNQYLDRMPNYKAFLDANPIVRLSLTSNTTSGAMYYAPYFDGNNDIEKYELFKTNWVKALLDGDTAGDTKTYKEHGTEKGKVAGYSGTLTTSTAVTAFMGSTGSWTAEVLDKDGKKLDAGIKVDYDKVAKAAKNESSPLGDAVKTAAGKAYTADNGNIIDLMNFAINEKQGEVTGAQLKKILQEYIKVAYYVGGTETPFYTQTGYNLSDVFIGYSAAWDVDLYAALGRVLVTNPSLLKSGSKGNTIGGTDATPWNNLFLLTARKNDMQRMIDTVSMVGQLYGVRGLESKNLYTYIGSDGKVTDARADAGTYEAMNKFHALWQEGLIHTGSNGNDGNQSFYTKDTPEALSTYDYVNTQTPAGFKLDGVTENSKYTIEEGYQYTPIITPVSKWNDGEEKIMRFTESWRTTKDTGFCVPKANVSDPAKLTAVLKIIDLMFSNDGQILLTYGPMATSATANDGYWYNREATAEEVAAGTYFEYQGKKLWSDVSYGGVYQPKILENVYKAYYGKTTAEGQVFDGTGITYAGAKVTTTAAVDSDGKLTADSKFSKNATFEYDVYYVKSNGSYEKIAAGAKLPADGYVVEGTITGDSEAKHYFVDQKCNIVGNGGKQIALISNTVSQWTTNATFNYINFARYVIGSALPLGNKLQSFEFQLTSTMGRKGASIVDAALGDLQDPTDGVVKHTVNNIVSNTWYTVIPTVLPYSKADTNLLTGTFVRLHDSGADKYFTNNKNTDTNLYWEIIKKGYTGHDKYETILTKGGTSTAASIIAKLNEVDRLETYITVKDGAWQKSKTYYNTIKG